MERAGVVPGARVLDLCCGPGLLTRLIKSTVGAEGEVVGVDLSEGMVTEARAQAEEEGLEISFHAEDVSFTRPAPEVAAAPAAPRCTPPLALTLRSPRRRRACRCRRRRSTR